MAGHPRGTRIEISLPAGEAPLSRLACAFPASLPHFTKQRDRGLTAAHA